MESGTCFRSNNEVGAGVEPATGWSPWVCRPPPRVPTRGTPTEMRAVGERPIGNTGPACLPMVGDKLQRYNPLSPPLDSGFRRRDEFGGTGAVAWYSESARWVLPGPTPTRAGDKPPHYIFSFRARPSVYKSARLAGGEPASRLIGGVHPGSESGTCFRSNRSCRHQPVRQGMKNLELWLGTANWHGGFCQAPPRPQRGTSPRTTFSRSALGHGCTTRQVLPVESRHRGRLEGMFSKPSLMPAGGRHTKVRRDGVVA